MCNTLPNSLKIYYGEVFCENCFHQHIMNSNKNNSCGFYKSCFEQWQSNSHFSEFINQFMSSGGQNRPIIVMQVPPPFCRCSSNNSDWCTSEPNKCEFNHIHIEIHYLLISMSRYSYAE